MKSVFKIQLLIFASAILFMQCEKEDPYVKITDNNFLNALIELGIDTNGDGQISQSEAEVVKSLDVGQNSISDMTGIEKFVSLETLECDRNQLTSLDVSNNVSLRFLYCGSNRLTTLDVSGNINLEYLSFGSNYEIPSIDVSNNTAI